MTSSEARVGQPGNEADLLAPSAFDCKTRKRFWQSEPDLSRLEKPLKSCLKSASRNPLAADVAVDAVDDLTDEALGVLPDDEDSDIDDSESEECLL